MIRRLDGSQPICDSHLGKMVRSWMDAAGVKDAPYDGKAAHSFRHTAISEIVDADPDLRVAQEFAGHAHLTSTQIYLRRAAPGRLRAAMERRSA